MSMRTTRPTSMSDHADVAFESSPVSYYTAKSQMQSGVLTGRSPALRNPSQDSWGASGVYKQSISVRTHSSSSVSASVSAQTMSVYVSEFIPRVYLICPVATDSAHGINSVDEIDLDTWLDELDSSGVTALVFETGDRGGSTLEKRSWAELFRNQFLTFGKTRHHLGSILDCVSALSFWYYLDRKDSVSLFDISNLNPVSLAAALLVLQDGGSVDQVCQTVANTVSGVRWTPSDKRYVSYVARLVEQPSHSYRPRAIMIKQILIDACFCSEKDLQVSLFDSYKTECVNLFQIQFYDAETRSIALTFPKMKLFVLNENIEIVISSKKLPKLRLIFRFNSAFVDNLTSSVLNLPLVQWDFPDEAAVVDPKFNVQIITVPAPMSQGTVVLPPYRGGLKCKTAFQKAHMVKPNAQLIEHFRTNGGFEETDIKIALQVSENNYLDATMFLYKYFVASGAAGGNEIFLVSKMASMKEGLKDGGLATSSVTASVNGDSSSSHNANSHKGVASTVASNVAGSYVMRVPRKFTLSTTPPLVKRRDDDLDLADMLLVPEEVLDNRRFVLPDGLIDQPKEMVNKFSEEKISAPLINVACSPMETSVVPRTVIHAASSPLEAWIVPPEVPMANLAAVNFKTTAPMMSPEITVPTFSAIMGSTTVPPALPRTLKIEAVAPETAAPTLPPAMKTEFVVPTLPTQTSAPALPPTMQAEFVLPALPLSVGSKTAAPALPPTMRVQTVAAPLPALVDPASPAIVWSKTAAPALPVMVGSKTAAPALPILVGSKSAAPAGPALPTFVGSKTAAPALPAFSGSKTAAPALPTLVGPALRVIAGSKGVAPAIVGSPVLTAGPVFTSGAVRVPSAPSSPPKLSFVSGVSGVATVVAAPFGKKGSMPGLPKAAVVPAVPNLPEDSSPGDLPLGRRLHWKPIRNVNDTIWATMHSGELSPSQFDGLKDVFDEEAKSNNKTVARSPKGSPGLEPARITLLEAKRAQNIGVVVARVPMEMVTIKLVNLNNQPPPPVEVLDRLKTVLPSEEEVASFVHFNCEDVKLLRDIEQRVFSLFRIPRLAQRIRFCLVAQQLPPMCVEVAHEISALRRSIEEIRNSQNLKKLLHLVLLLGNYVNHGAAGNKTRGFSIESLSKLMEFKSLSDPSITTLHFLAVRLLTTEPSLINMFAELPSLKAAAGKSIESIAQSIQAIRRDPEFIRAEIASSVYSPESVATMSGFVGSIEKQIEAILSEWTLAEQEMTDIRKFFGEDPRKISMDDFFSHLLSFFDQLTQTCADLKKKPKKFDKIKRAHIAHSHAD